MSPCTKLHNEAMALIDDADLLKNAETVRGKSFRKRLLWHALFNEYQAALLAETEPSRSILRRSAAWIAIEYGDAARAKYIAEEGLALEGVPNRVRRELEEVLERAEADIQKQQQENKNAE